MDLATLLGLVMAVGAVYGAFALEGGTADALFLAAPILIVVGGTLGATTVTTSMSTVLRVPNYLRLAFWHRERSKNDTINTLVSLAEKARRDGILGLESRLRELRNPFFVKAVKLVIDGTEVTVLREILETEMGAIEERHKRGITFFHKAGGFSPTMGILGTVLGLIQALGTARDAAAMASSIAVAFIATMWGVGLANLFFLPISDKLRLRHDEEMEHLELITEGVIALQSGESPRNIRTRLASFVAPRVRVSEV
jgi:chemotaxis protein MotA